jgi:glycolate oxidase iron-sulfur subunit
VNEPSSSAQALLREADRCVMCGMCLPHCPTFRRTGTEAESPRGRISLAQALARGQLPADDALAAHLDHCLGCRACEAMCPSEVRYGAILGHARRLLAEQRGKSLIARGADLLTRPGVLRTAVRVGASPLAALGKPLSATTRRLAALAQARPRQVFRWQGADAPGTRGRIGLFLGCTGEAVDGEALSATEQVLTLLGFTIETPRGQGCCGALHHGQGDRSGFERRARRNLEAFPVAELDAIVGVASGCVAMLREYGQWLDHSEATPLAAKTREITDFLAELDWAGLPAPAPLPAIAAVHVPCSQANVLRRPNAAVQLLRRIPALQVLPLADNAACCGAAGSYMLEQPATAEALRDPKLDALVASGAQYLVTTNVGCALHLAAGAKARGLQVEVMHPVSLLARQLAAAAVSL